MLQLYKNIKSRRLELNLTQSDLAQKLGYADKSMIAKIEKGQVDLTQSKIVAFAEALQTTPGELMGWNNNSEITCNDDSLKKSISNISREIMTFSKADKIFIDMVYELLEKELEKSKLDEFTKKVRENLPNDFGMSKPTTLAAHFEGEDFTDEELDEIKQFAEFVKNRKKPQN